MSDIIFDLEPLDVADEKSFSATPVLRTAFGKENRISMSPPRMQPFDPSLFAAAAALAGNDGDGLKMVSTTLSFIPDFGCAFVAADFSLEFSLDGEETPVVVDLAPRETFREEDYQSAQERTLSLKGKVAPGLAEILAEAGLSASVEVGGKRRIRDIWAFGLGGSEAGWRFQSSVGHRLAGIYDDLRLAVRCPRDAVLQARVRFGAEIAVENQIDQWATLAFGLGHKRTEASATFAIAGG